MPRTKTSILTDLSTGDLKRLLAARERIDVLEDEKRRLTAELAKVEKELAKLLAGGTTAGVGRRTVRKKTTVRKKKTVGRKKTVKAKAAGRKGTKKTVRKAAGKPTRKAPRRAAAGKVAGRVKLEDVVLGVLKKKGQPMAFKELYDAIVGGKLFKSKSKNFDNVLRRTLSTSKLVKRVSRGVYDAA